MPRTGAMTRPSLRGPLSRSRTARLAMPVSSTVLTGHCRGTAVREVPEPCGTPAPTWTVVFAGTTVFAETSVLAGTTVLAGTAGPCWAATMVATVQ